MATANLRAESAPANPLSRQAIEGAIETLIALLDAIDGDPDLEPETDMCSAGDDGCGPVWRMGELHWGSVWDEQGH